MAFAAAASGRLPSSRATCTRAQCPRMGPWKAGEKDAAFQQQQEILARRRDKKRAKQYFQDVRERRNELEENLMQRRLVVRDGEDPLIPWKRMKDAGLIDDAGYTEEDEGGIPIPMASFGIPKYDNGGRFDLKLPHVEIGYTDESADVMGKAGRALKNLFGFGNAKEETDGDEASKDDAQGE